MIRLNEGDARWLAEELGAAPSPPMNLAEERAHDLARVINEQLNNPRHFDDLVDTIIKVIQDPRVNSMNRDTLQLLRRAVLSPLELAKYNAMLNKGQDCASCGRRLNGYEAVTLVNRQAHCYRCYNAMYVTCPGCEEPVDVSGIGKAIERQLQRHTCRPQRREEEDDVPQATAPPLRVAQRLAAAAARTISNPRPASVLETSTLVWQAAPPIAVTAAATGGVAPLDGGPNGWPDEDDNG